MRPHHVLSRYVNILDLTIPVCCGKPSLADVGSVADHLVRHIVIETVRDTFAANRVGTHARQQPQYDRSHLILAVDR